MKNNRIRDILRLSATVLALGCALSARADVPAMESNGMLVDAAGMTLYTLDRDTDGKSTCNGPCAANWPPLMALKESAAAGDWSIVTRDDGSKQWAYKGKPLYRFMKDQKAGDRMGEGMLNNMWHSAKP